MFRSTSYTKVNGKRTYSIIEYDARPNKRQKLNKEEVSVIEPIGCESIPNETWFRVVELSGGFEGILAMKMLSMTCKYMQETLVPIFTRKIVTEKITPMKGNFAPTVTSIKNREYWQWLAAACGYLNILIYLNLSMGINVTQRIAYVAAKYGKLQCLDYVLCFAQGTAPEECKTAYMSECAARGGLECLKLVRSYGYRWDYHVYMRAMRWNRKEVIDYARENGCQMDESILLKAIEIGSLEYFKYFIEQNCPRAGNRVFLHAARLGRVDILEFEGGLRGYLNDPYQMELAAIEAMKNESLSSFEFIVKRLGITYQMCENIRFNAGMRCFMHIVDNCRPSLIHMATMESVRGGKASFLRYLHSKGIEFTHEHLHEAVKFGRIECLQYLRESGVGMTEDDCAAAAYSGSLDCLKYLHENGCPWNYKTLERAAIKSMECLMYAIENGCELKITMSGYGRIFDPQLSLIHNMITEGKCMVIPNDP